MGRCDIRRLIPIGYTFEKSIPLVVSVIVEIFGFIFVKRSRFKRNTPCLCQRFHRLLFRLGFFSFMMIDVGQNNRITQFV